MCFSVGEVPKITAIKPQKNNPHRYSVFIDGQFALGVVEEVIINLGLRPQEPITTDRLAQVVAEEQIQQAWKAATRLLAYRPRSRQELRLRLRQKHFSGPITSRVMDRLADLGLVNDEDFARELVQSLVRGHSLGKRAILDRLRRAGISHEIAEATIERELADYDEGSQAQQAADKYLARRAALDPDRRHRRLYEYLRRRGFSHSVIRQVLDGIENGSCCDGVPGGGKDGPFPVVADGS